MKLEEIFKNLVDYEKSTKKIKINEKDYRITPVFKKKTPKAFVGLAFGSGKRYNQILGDSILDAKKYFKKFSKKTIPIFVQTEIGNFLKKEKSVYTFGETYKKGESSKVISKVDSYEILRQISEKMDELSVSKKDVLYFAHPSHVYRVQEQGKIFGIKGGVFIPERIVWPEKDPQWWVQNPENWKKREKMGRLFLWLTGKIKREF
jgi:hypothetical protein